MHFSLLLKSAHICQSQVCENQPKTSIEVIRTVKFLYFVEALLNIFVNKYVKENSNIEVCQKNLGKNTGTFYASFALII